MHVLVDVAVVAIVIVALIAGWKQGALGSIVSAVGIAAGLIVGLALAPVAMRATDSQAARVAILIGLNVVLVGLGNGVGAAAGGQLRDIVRGPVRWIDSLFGAAFQGIVVALVLWFVSVPLASSLPGAVGDGIRGSRALTAIDAAAPSALSQLPARAAVILDQTGLPPLVSPFGAPRGAHVDAPDASVVSPEMVAQARPAVVQVMGDSASCQRRIMGSGFVIAEDYVLTNAHVVAGTSEVALDTVLGVKDAQVVFYDPEVDIAVVRAERLGIEPLRWADRPLVVGDDTVVMGYPLSGPFEAAPARIRGKFSISGPDIYVAGRVTREAYALRGTIRQGNSGGPLVDTAGDVVGMIFGASVDATDTGYALTSDQVRERIGDIAALTSPADTRGCVGG